MIAQATKLLRQHLPLLIGSIAAILVGGIAITSLAIPSRDVGSVAAAANPPTAAIPDGAAPRALYNRCAECGVIDSVHGLDAPDKRSGADASDRTGKRGASAARPYRNYEIIIRMHDGSMRVIKDPKPARWRRGEPVTVIANADG